MAILKIIGRKGSRSKLSIARETGIGLYKGLTRGKVDCIINYGLAGQYLDAFIHKYPLINNIPTINRRVGLSKLHVIGLAKAADIDVPDSKLALSIKDDKDEFIEKRINSIGGRGICKAKGKGPIPGKYYQHFIDNRRYELRVHAFLWTDDWTIQKRLGDDDQIAWNFEQGGRFATIHNPDNHGLFKRAKEIAAKVLKITNMAFGAVDFVVDEDRKIWFLEVNSSPGFTELSGPIYVNAFNKLKKLPLKQVLQYTA